jgi:hypothetical protein
MREGAILISLIQLERNPDLLPVLLEKKISAVALERVCRASPAPRRWTCSAPWRTSAGYRAVIEAADAYQGFFGAQVTAAGSLPPGEGAHDRRRAWRASRRSAQPGLGAEVRAFDTRAAAREQVESLGATFLEVAMEESGEGGGGYAKEMSKEFIEAEMRLFREAGRGRERGHHHGARPRQACADAPSSRCRRGLQAWQRDHRSWPQSRVATASSPCLGKVIQSPGHHGGGLRRIWRAAWPRSTSKFFAANVAAPRRRDGRGSCFQARSRERCASPRVGHPRPWREASAAAPQRRALAARGRSARRDLHLRTPSPSKRPSPQPTRKAWGTTLGGMVAHRAALRARSLRARGLPPALHRLHPRVLRGLAGDLERESCAAHAAHERHQRHQRHHRGGRHAADRAGELDARLGPRCARHALRGDQRRGRLPRHPAHAEDVPEDRPRTSGGHG